MLPAAPNIETLRDLFQEHLVTHRKLPDSARIRDLGGERELIRDYCGRVVFELLQNALDRCKNTVLIALCIKEDGSGTLIVGNDGASVTAHRQAMGASSGTSPIRGASDFHALLSLHSSTKSAGDSIGHKGVGFRSVFASCERVAVWSRSSSGGWWCLQLEHPTEVPEHGEWSDNQVASFYNPQMDLVADDLALSEALGLNENLEKVLGDLVTLVVLPNIPQNQMNPKKDVYTSVQLLENHCLGFLHEKYPEKKIQLNLQIHDPEKPVFTKRNVGFEEGWVYEKGNSIELTDGMRQRSGMELCEGNVIVALAPGVAERNASDTVIQGSTVYWSYLPTEQPAGFGVEIHADFYLNNSRRNVTFRLEEGEDPQNYNGKLLKSAAVAIVNGLWRKPEVLEGDDFWRLANPNSCECSALRNQVARLLLTEETFCRIAAASFPNNDRKWPLERYKDLFKAVVDWADYAYRNSIEGIQHDALCRLKERFADYVRISKAKVFPIVSHLKNEMGPVPEAIPLPAKLEKGKSRGGNLYFRSGERGEAFDLPKVLKKQGSYVTAFRPDGMSESDCGMVEFNRVEILGRLKPGEDDLEHEELLQTAIKLACERTMGGGGATVLERCLDFETSAWRFLVGMDSKRATDLEHAAVSLSGLYLPVVGGGWKPANQVTCPTPESLAALSEVRQEWPWPVVDADRLNKYVPKLADVEDAGIQTDSLLILLGVSPIPLQIQDKQPMLIDGWSNQDSEVRRSIATEIIKSWPRFLGPLLQGDLPAVAKLKQQMVVTEWVPGSCSETVLGGRLSFHRAESSGFMAPIRLWLQRSGAGGFRSRDLPVLIVSDTKAPPTWARDCGIVEAGHGANPEKILLALQGLEKLTPSAAETRDLYTRLIRALPEDQPAPGIPILVRRFERGRSVEMKWRSPDEKVWFDNGEHTSLISGFPRISVWEVRREKATLAGSLGIELFKPSKSTPPREGSGNKAMEDGLRRLFHRAMPDLFAACSLARVGQEFNEEQGLENLARLEVRHYDDVWVDLEQEGLGTGKLGQNEDGNIFVDPSNRVKLLFDLKDGSRLPELLLECVTPLAEALCGNRAFVPVFSQVLTAWSHAGTACDDLPSTVDRLRRNLCITDDELVEWQKRIEFTVLSQEERAAWSDAIRSVLEEFGELREESGIGPGCTVTQNCWVVSSPSSSPTEGELRSRLETRLSSLATTKRAFMIPKVDFVSWNRGRLQGLAHEHIDRLLAMRAIAENKSCNEWSELLQEKSELLEKVSKVDNALDHPVLSLAWPGEDELLEILKGMIGSAPESEISSEYTSRLVAFLREGVIPVTVSSLIQCGQYELCSWPQGNGASKPMKPMDMEQRIQRDLANSKEGERAELGVLQLAQSQASDWLNENQKCFWEALHEALSPNGERVKKIEEVKADPAKLKDLLYVAKWWGNAGYDVLVPQRGTHTTEWSFKKVEIKRVRVEQGVLSFHLSENERRRSIETSIQDADWRLWLVSVDGRGRDVTEVVRDNTLVHESIDSPCLHGLYPESYIIRLKEQS